MYFAIPFYSHPKAQRSSRDGITHTRNKHERYNTDKHITERAAAGYITTEKRAKSEEEKREVSRDIGFYT
ncbi:hypothetical protein TNCV_3955871 [Trichonephila clavipes]|nr:hypothetical protein TNCV_3955871 [Trichonephila clavipes]